MFDIIAIPLGWLLKVIYDVVGNYGVALVLFTLVTKIILFPLAWNQKKSSIKMAIFQPMINDINKKYANDKAKQQEELMRLQKEHGFSATAGCLPLLIQLPILFGLIQVIYKPLTHVARISAEVITAATPIAQEVLGSLSKYSAESSILAAVRQNPAAFSSVMNESEIHFIQNFNMSFLGLDLTVVPSITSPGIIWIIPVLSVGAMLFQQILMMKLNGQKMEGAMKWMPIYTTIMFGWFSFAVPAGVSIYWIFSSVFGILQDLFLRIFFDPEKEKAKIEQEMKEAKKRAKAQNNKKAMPDEKGRMTASQNELAKKRLEKARQLQKESEEELTEAEKELIKERLERARQLEKDGE